MVVIAAARMSMMKYHKGRIKRWWNDASQNGIEDGEGERERSGGRRNFSRKNSRKRMQGKRMNLLPGLAKQLHHQEHKSCVLQSVCWSHTTCQFLQPSHSLLPASTWLCSSIQRLPDTECTTSLREKKIRDKERKGWSKDEKMRKSKLIVKLVPTKKEKKEK